MEDSPHAPGGLCPVRTGDEQQIVLQAAAAKEN
jgi:hypothetical protein